MALIKSYLPIRIQLAEDDLTFCYVKEHRDTDRSQQEETGAKKKRSSTGSSTNTLFVANAPVIPKVPTKKVLEALFGRYGEIKCVSLIDRARKSQDVMGESWSKFEGQPSFRSPTADYSKGKFAHVVFETPRDAKRALRDLAKIMKSGKSIEFTAVEIQTLADDAEEGIEEDTSIVQRLKQRYLNSIPSRADIMDECNAIIEEYERLEDEDKRNRAEAAKQSDDGFVTVSYSSQIGSKRELEEPLDQSIGNRVNSKRSRKKKESIGSSQLQDFYRFQTKEKKKKTVQELREQFQRDLDKIERLKEEKKYKPF